MKTIILCVKVMAEIHRNGSVSLQLCRFFESNLRTATFLPIKKDEKVNSSFNSSKRVTFRLLDIRTDLISVWFP